MGVARAAMGDMALLDPYKSFDLFEEDKNTSIAVLNRTYLYGIEIVYFTFFIYIIGQFFLFMIFMNFIIAVITECHGEINKKEESYDF